MLKLETYEYSLFVKVGEVTANALVGLALVDFNGLTGSSKDQYQNNTQLEKI